MKSALYTTDDKQGGQAEEKGAVSLRTGFISASQRPALPRFLKCLPWRVDLCAPIFSETLILGNIFLLNKNREPKHVTKRVWAAAEFQNTCLRRLPQTTLRTTRMRV